MSVHSNGKELIGWESLKMQIRLGIVKSKTCEKVEKAVIQNNPGRGVSQS